MNLKRWGIYAADRFKINPEIWNLIQINPGTNILLGLKDTERHKKSEERFPSGTFLSETIKGTEAKLF